MEILQTNNALLEFRKNNNDSDLGFVPTMGALHEGHLSLIETSKQSCNKTIVSIFVNPLQFNNRQDFEKYPNTIEHDIEVLKSIQIDALYLPTEEEIYRSYKIKQFNLGILDEVMEGKFRPGHFSGMANVVYRLLTLISPQKAFFGEKDFQQLAIVKKITKDHKLPVDIIPCPTKRETDGLAMSSRNMRLTAEQRKTALIIPKLLISLKKEAANTKDINKLKETGTKILSEENNFRLEYLEFADSETFQTETSVNKGKTRIFIAGYVGEIRLIDNMLIG